MSQLSRAGTLNNWLQLPGPSPGLVEDVGGPQQRQQANNTPLSGAHMISAPAAEVEVVCNTLEEANRTEGGLPSDQADAQAYIKPLPSPAPSSRHPSNVASANTNVSSTPPPGYPCSSEHPNPRPLSPYRAEPTSPSLLVGQESVPSSTSIPSSLRSSHDRVGTPASNLARSCFSGIAGMDSNSSDLPMTSNPKPEANDEAQEVKGAKENNSHKATMYGKHVNALTRKSIVYQRRKACSTACLLVGPIFFPILMFALQAATNALYVDKAEYKCGCQCTQCCTNTQTAGGTKKQCSPVTSGTCSGSGSKCEAYDKNNCGIRYSTTTQAVFCPIRRPSSWPPVMGMPNPIYFPPPYGPFQAMPMLYTSDSGGLASAKELSQTTPGKSLGSFRRRLRSHPGLGPDPDPDLGSDGSLNAPAMSTTSAQPGGERSLLANEATSASSSGGINLSENGTLVLSGYINGTDTGYLYRKDRQWEIETGNNGSAIDNAQLIANSLLNLPLSPSITAASEVLYLLNNLVVETTDGSVYFNGYLLALLGFKFGSAHAPPTQYYIETTFLNSGGLSVTNVIMVMMPNKTCENRNMSYNIFQTETTVDGKPFVYWVDRSYDPATFLIKFYSYEINGLQEFLAAQGFDPQKLIQGTILENIRLGCVDGPSKRLASSEVVDDTLFCGWYQDGPVGECFEKYNKSYYGPTESYAVAFDFTPEISISNFSAIVQQNCSLRLKGNSPADGFCRYESLLNLAVQGWETAFIGAPQKPNTSSLFQNGTVSVNSIRDFLNSKQAQQEFKDNKDFNTTLDFFRNNNATEFFSNRTAQESARGFFTNKTVQERLLNKGSLQNVSQPFLNALGSGTQPLSWRSNELLGVMSFPKLATGLTINFSSLIGPLFYCWVAQLAMPSMLQQLVYEKEKRLRVIMKMHGLPDTAYWLVSYVWNYLVYAAGILIFVIIGSAVGLDYFIKNSYGVQAVFYILFGQVQMAFTFFLSALFSDSRTAVVAGFVYVLASGLLGYLLFQPLMDQNYWWLWLVELIPALSLYRGLFEFGAYSARSAVSTIPGMRFQDLSNKKNGMVTVWIIMAVEWAVFMLLAWYIEQVVPTGNGTPRHPLFMLHWMWKKKDKLNPWAPESKILDGNSSSKPSTSAESSEPDSVAVMIERDFNTKYDDVKAEVARVEQIQSWPPEHMPIITAVHLSKVFPSLGGSTPKLAVKDMTIGISMGECLGLLGPNGAGKTTSINILTGLIKPSGGDAIIAGYSIRKDMPQIHRVMGVCPQHDLTWEVLTGREHLLFYGRLKGLTGRALEDAVEEGLHSVALHGLVGDKLAGEYSGGMRRRLSVGMAFMGRPKVVYLDEPSTGLDPMSRKQLWSVIKTNKSSCAIILTTHSMQEAELLCDRIGIFVEGQLVCLDTPSQITSRFAGFLVLTLTVPLDQEAQARKLAESLAPSAHLSYALGGTLKYELPKDQVTLSAVFTAVHAAKEAGLRMEDWAVTSATLEEVFIKLARLAVDTDLV